VTAQRAPENPIVTPAMVLPSRPDFEVLGVFNPAVARHDGQVVLLLRVAEAIYEREGFFGKVVFTCGALVDGDQVRVYYGAADGVTAVADLSLAEILSGLAEP
jgi:predicted GH43/DUF377 family glycosyl hydrolase